MALPLPKIPLLNEVAANMMIDYFKANFNSYLADLDNQYSDGISLEPVGDESIYISDKFETLQPPAVYFLFGEMAFNYTNDQNYLDAVNTCLVVLTVEDFGADTLMTKAWRYARVLYGIYNLVEFEDPAGRLYMKTVPKRLGYSDQQVTDKMKESDRKYRKDCVLELEIVHHEKNLT